MSRLTLSSLGLLVLLGLATVNIGAQEPASRTLGSTAQDGSFLISDIAIEGNSVPTRRNPTVGSKP